MINMGNAEMTRAENAIKISKERLVREVIQLLAGGAPKHPSSETGSVRLQGGILKDRLLTGATAEKLTSPFKGALSTRLTFDSAENYRKYRIDRLLQSKTRL